ncbi:MAG: phosphoglucosamine mutase [Candidatus Marinimicrobia bacterium]|nr:phosphoglucosamine mutase [Candidatus Neomarinimicrobiota bacterium]
MLIETISGVRGIIPQDFNESVISRYVGAFHSLCGEGAIIVGRDTRASGSKLTSAVIEALLTSGRDVIDCGICPTPTVQFAVEDTDAVGGLVITASHNPEEWNGLKFIAQDGCFLNEDVFGDLMRFANQGARETAGESGNYVRFDQAVRRHIQRVLRIDWVDVDKIKDCNYKVAVDTVNGAAAEALPLLLKRLGCDVVSINCELSGEFTRGTEPLPENLSGLTQLVQEENCHIGFATDPDADRLAVVDENGKPVGEEYTLVLALDGFLSTTGDLEPIVTNLSTTMAVEKVAERYGAEVHRSAVGEINVVEMMKESGSRIGGEGNGGVILKEVHLGRDSLVGVAIILDSMARTSQPLTAIFRQLPQFHMVKEKVTVDGSMAEESWQRIAEQFDGAATSFVDGLKLKWSDRWVHIRRSNTEPIVRIYAEAPTEDEALSLARKVSELDVFTADPAMT